MSERRATVIGKMEKPQRSPIILIEHEFALAFDINQTKLRLLEVLVREAKGSRLKGNIVYLDHSALEEELGVTRTSIFNYIKSLESAGLIKKVKPRQEVYEINADLMKVCTVRDATVKPKSTR